MFMQRFDFKKLEVEKDKNWFKRNFGSQHAKRTILFATVGAIGGVLYFYFTEGKNMAVIETGDIIKSMMLGAFLGVFITNSPCARGRC